jgi:hypothetical protein
MAVFNVLRWHHPMVGVDWHIPVLPIGPLPFPSPYFVVQIMGNWVVQLSTLYTPSVYADATQSAMCKGTDIGSLIPHVGTPSIIIFIEILFSSSKSHFGPSAVVVSDQYGAAKNPAAAVGVVVNPNLNCGFPVPTPLDVVIATNTTQVAMTWGDIIGGLYSMVVDAVFQTIINLISFKVLGPAMEGLGRRLAPRLGIRALSRAASRQAGRAAWKAAGKQGPLSAFANPLRNGPIMRFAERFGMGGDKAIGFFLGSPLGLSADAPALGLPTVYGAFMEGIQWLGVPSEQDVQQWVDQPASTNTPATPTPTGTSTSTSTPTNTPTSTPTNTPTSTPTPTGTSTSTPTTTPTPTSTPTSTPTTTPTTTSTPTTTPTTQNTCEPDDPVSGYFDDPSVEHIGDPAPQ